MGWRMARRGVLIGWQKHCICWQKTKIAFVKVAQFVTFRR
jgi:hypothetical protein